MPTQKPSVTVNSQLIDTGDGSGDAFLVLPDEVLAITGWKIGDELTSEVIDGVEQVARTETRCPHVWMPKLGLSKHCLMSW